jgi:hypothetical protein
MKYIESIMKKTEEAKTKRSQRKTYNVFVEDNKT